MEKRLYLASGSPRRHTLLTQAGYAFEFLATSVDEDALTANFSGPLSELGEYLAACKAHAAVEVLHHSGRAGVVLTADTTVLIENESLAKPATRDEARHMLERLCGVQHTVATGVAVADIESDMLLLATSRTLVTMRSYSEHELQAYVATDDPLDKAGAYSIQHPQFNPVASTSGCYSGVIGLPLCLVSKMLTMVGIPLSQVAQSHKRSDAECWWTSQCSQPYPTDVRVCRLTESSGQRRV